MLSMKQKGRFKLLFILVLSGSVWAGDWPEPPVPEGARLEMVAENMLVNGVPMRTWTLSAAQAARETLDFYRELWETEATGERPGFTEQEMGKWRLLTRLQGDYLITVQVDTEQPLSTRGLVGVSKLPAMQSLPKLGKNFPTPGQTQIINDIHATDLNKKSRTLVATSNRSMRSVIRFYRTTFEKDGWQEQTGRTPYSGQDDFALIFDKGQRQLSMIFARQAGKTALVAVYVEQ